MDAMQIHACRSPQQITEDVIVNAHDEITHLLSIMCSGECLYQREERRALKALAAECEAFILGDGPAPTNVYARIYHIIRMK